MNIIIAGDGEVGFHLAKILSNANHNITVVDPHAELLKLISVHTDIRTLEGNSTSISVLEKANVKRTDLLISVLHDEKTNLFTCILGKKAGAKRTIARVDNLEFLETHNLEMLKTLGIDEVVCPELLAAEEILSLLRQTAATEMVDFSEGKLSLMLLKLDENAKVLNMTLDQIASEYKKLNFRAVAIHRNGQTMIPRGSDRFLINDMAYTITKPDGIDMLLELGGKKSVIINRVMIGGGGRIGMKTARKLENSKTVSLIELDETLCYQLSQQLKNTTVIHGDIRNIELLNREGLKKTDAFIAVTDNSEANMITAMYAKQAGVKKAIALVENLDYIQISKNIGIDAVVNKKMLTAGYIARFTMQAEVTSIKLLSGIEAEVMELVVHPGSPVVNKTINKLSFPEGAVIGGIVRGNESYIAVGDFKILENDKVVILAMPKSVSRVEKLFD